MQYKEDKKKTIAFLKFIFISPFKILCFCFIIHNMYYLPLGICGGLVPETFKDIKIYECLRLLYKMI